MSSVRRGDGAQRAVLALTKLPVVTPAALPKPEKASPEKPDSTTPEPQQPDKSEASDKSTGIFEGLRDLSHLQLELGLHYLFSIPSTHPDMAQPGTSFWGKSRQRWGRSW